MKCVSEGQPCLSVGMFRESRVLSLSEGVATGGCPRGEWRLIVIVITQISAQAVMSLCKHKSLTLLCI